MKRLYLFIFSMLLGSVFAQGPALTIGNVDYDANTIEIYYDFQQDFAGFQFNIDGVTLTDNAYGGLIDEYGVLNIFVDPVDGLVFGFSWEPISIPGGSGLLGILTFSDLSYTDICLSNGSFSSPEGQTLVSGLEDCVDCAGDEYGDAAWDDCNVCSGGS